MANNPNILIGLKLKDIDDLKNKCQKDIDKLGKQLNLSISKIEIKDIDKATNKIQKQLNKISNQLTMNIKNIQLGNTDKVFKDLNRQIKQSIGNQDIKINTASDLKTVKGDFENILKYATLTRNEFKLVNGELAKMNTLTTKEGAVKSTTLTYQYDEARQAVEKYGWTAKQEGNKVVQVFDLISRKLVDNKKQLENNFTSQDKYLIGLENKLNKIKELSLRQGRANENYNNAKDLEEVVIIQNKINELKSKNNLLTQEEKNLLNQNIIELDNIVKKESGYAAEVNKTTQFLEKQIQTLESLKTNISNNKGNKEEEAKITNEINLQIEGYKKLIQQNEVLGSVEQNRIQKATNSIKQETNELITYGSKLKGILKSVAEYAVGGSALLGGVNVIKTGIDNIIELDSSMTTLKRVTSETTQTYKEFGDQANQTAIDIGHSTQEVINATADFAQAGFNSFKEDKDLAKISLIYSNVGDVSREEATKSMISTLKGFNLEAKDALSVVDKFNETSNKFSINAGGIGEALQRSASALHVAGNDISESIAMITAANTVVQDPSRVGNGLKTISMNLRGMKQTAEGAKPKLEKMMNTVTNGQVKITSLGKDGNKEFRSTYDILLDLSKVWGKLNSQQQAMLGEQIAGKHQANVFFSLMDQAKQLEEIKKTSMGSAGSAMAEEKAYMDSLKGRINALKENWKGLTMQLSNTSFLKNIISGANSILTAIRKIIDTFGVLPTLIGGITGAMVLFNDKFREKLENNILLLKKINNKFNDISKSFRDKARGITGFDDGKGDKIIGQFETLKNAFDSGEKSAIRYGASMVGLQAKLFAVKGAMVAAKVAAITLEAALTAGISLIASFVIEKAVEGFSALQKSIHMTREQLSEFNAEYIKNSSNSLKEIDNAERGLSKIQALKKEMNETSDGERRASLQKQLIELQREMVDTFPATASGLDSEGKKIATNNELIKAQINLKKEEARTSALNFFKKNKNTISELEGYKKQLDEVKKLQNDLENGKDFGKVQYRGAAAWAKRSVKDLEDMQKKMSETAQKAEGLRQAIQAYHAVGKTDTEINAIAGYNAVGALKSYDDALKEMSKSSESATSSSNGMNTALELVGENAENAAQKIKDLATNFGSLTGKLGVAKKALEEFQNKGRLSADTIQSIFNTGDTKLIASLGDASHFAQNLRGIIKNYSGEQKQAFNDEVNQARRMEYNKTNSAIKGSATRNSVTRNEVGNNKNAYNNDVGNFGNSEIAKANASSQSVNNRVSNEANGSQLFAGVYGKDIANQANAEAIKSNNTAQGVGARTGTEAVGCWNLSGLYGADTSNHASAQGIKTSNSAQSSDQRFGIENNATTNFAGLYGTDVNNHSGAQGTKVSNTGSAVNSIGSKHTGLVDSLGRVYGTDVENWSKAMNSKLEATSNFVGQAAQMLSSLSSVQTVEIGGFGSGMKANKFTDPRLGGLMMDAAKHMGRDPMAGYKALVDTSNVNSGYSPVSSGGYSPQSSDFVGFDNDSGGGSGGGSSYKPKKYSGSGGSGGGSSYKPKKYSGSGSGGSGSSGKLGKSGSSGSSEPKIDIKDIEEKVDRYKSLQDALNDVNNEISENIALEEMTKGSKKIDYINKEIDLYNNKKNSINNLIDAKKKEAREIERELKARGLHANDGNIDNYSKRLNQIRDNANAMSNSNKAKEKAIDDYKKLTEQTNKYLDLTSTEIPNLRKEWLETGKAIEDTRRKILDLVSDTEKEITDVIKNEIEKRKKALESVTDKTKEELNRQKDLLNDTNDKEDSERELKEKQDALNKINSQIDSVERDSSADGQARLKELLQQQKDARKDLDSFMRDKHKDEANKLFDKTIDDLDKKKDEKIKEMEDKYTDSKIVELAKGMIKTGFIEIEGHVIKLRDSIKEYYKDQGDVFSNSSLKMQEFIDKLEQTKKLYGDISSINKGLGIDSSNIISNNAITSVPRVKAISMFAKPNKSNITIKSDLHIGTLNEGSKDDLRKLLDENNNKLIKKISEQMNAY